MAVKRRRYQINAEHAARMTAEAHATGTHAAHERAIVAHRHAAESAIEARLPHEHHSITAMQSHIDAQRGGAAPRQHFAGGGSAPVSSSGGARAQHRATIVTEGGGSFSGYGATPEAAEAEARRQHARSPMRDLPGTLVATRPKAVSQTQHGTATTHTPHDQAMARASGALERGSTGAPSLLATQRSHDANRRVYEAAMNASYAAHAATQRPDPEDSMQPHQYHERAAQLHRAAAEHATRVGDAAQAAVHQRELARHTQQAGAQRNPSALSDAAYAASRATYARHGDASVHETARAAHLAAAAAHRAAGNEVQARSHETAARGHTFDAGSARGTSRDRALPSDPADVRGARQARAAAPAARTPLPVQQGKKGGTFVISKSGKKRYVKKR